MAGDAATTEQYPDPRGPNVPAAPGASGHTEVDEPTGGIPSRARGVLSGVLGRYTILQRLGEGGMGEVYLAHDATFNCKVALKIPHFAQDGEELALQRFYREARSAFQLRHSNICPVYDVGEIGGQHYISMAYIEGRPLSAFIDPDRPLTERQVARVVRKIALAMQEAHQLGIVHRDLKPGNIMFDETRMEPIVLDFGLARQVGGSDDPRLTQVGMLVGSPAYMSPEHVTFEQNEVGPASDIYSLGVIMYELLTGRVPFDGSPVIVVRRLMLETPAPPSRFRPGLDPHLEAICLKAIAKKVEDRYASMLDFAMALAEHQQVHMSIKDASDFALFGAEEEYEPPLEAVTPPLPAPAFNPLPIPVSTSPGGTQRMERLRGAFRQRDKGWFSKDKKLQIAGGIAAALVLFGILYAVFGPRNPPPGGAGTNPAAHQQGGAPAARPLDKDESAASGRPSPDAVHQPAAGRDANGPPDFDRRRRGPPPRVVEEFNAADLNGDGLVDPDEYPLHIIRRGDTNGDDRLTREEFDAGRKKGGQFFGPPNERDMETLPPFEPGEDRPPPKRRPTDDRPPPRKAS